MAPPSETAGKWLRSLTTRKYLLGVVLGWVLVVYLVASPSPSSAPAVPSGRTPVPLAAPAAALPALSVSSPAVSAPVSTAPSLGGFPALSFSAPPAPPAAAPALNCPYPIPQSQTTPFNPGIFLNFEGPFIEMSGPFATWDIPTLGAIAPLVPFATPLVYISEPVMNSLTPNVSQFAADYATIISDAGLDSPQEQQYANDYEPDWIEFLDEFTPYESAFASSTAGQCLELFENELAVMDSQENVSLPNPPIIVPAVPSGSTSAQAQAVEAATAADSRGSMAQLVLPWSGGVPAGLTPTEDALRAKGHPVELVLVDDPPAGASMGGTGFSDFVAEAVHGSPEVSSFEVDVPSADPTGTDQMADLVHGLAAADFARIPGQTIGLGVAPAATGSGADGFWKAFDGAIEGWQANMVDFVAADLTPRSQATLAGEEAEAVASARSLEAAFSSFGGVPVGVPVFGTVSLAGAGPWSVSAVQGQIAGFLDALRGLKVNVLGVDSGT